LDGHRFCEAGKNEPNQDNPDLWFWHYPYHASDSDDTAIDATYQDAYNNVTSGLNAAAVASKWPTYTAFEDALYDVINMNQLTTESTSVPGEVGAQGPWDGVIGYRAKLFHPQVDYHSYIRDTVLHRMQVDSISPTSSAPAPTKTATPPASPSLTCNGVNNNKWVDPASIYNQIPIFCKAAAAQGTQDPNTGGLARWYNAGTSDYMVLAIDWPPGNPFKPDETSCNSILKSIADGKLFLLSLSTTMADTISNFCQRLRR